jgi:hypothetical protein
MKVGQASLLASFVGEQDEVVSKPQFKNSENPMMRVTL